MDFVLIHDAWHGGWVWQKLIAELEARGHRAVAPDLPISESMAQCVDAVVEVVETCEGSCCLVGHGWGGLVAAQVAERQHERIDRLIYLAAFAPTSNESLSSFEPINRASALRGGIDEVGDDLLLVRPTVAPQAMYADCHAEDVEEAIERLRPQHAGTFDAAVSVSADRLGNITKQYIECIEDQAVHISAQRTMAIKAGCFQINSLRTGHVPQLSAPVELTGFLVLSGPPAH